MSINGIGSYQLAATSLYPEQTHAATAVESDGDVDRSRITAPVDTSGKSGLFATAISQTLFQIGVTPTAANVATNAAPTGTQQQTLASFAQNLLGTFQTIGQNSGSPTNSRTPGATKGTARSTIPGSNITTANTASGTTTPAPNLAINSSLQNHLQNLIQELSSGSNGDTSSLAGQALAQLQQSYQGVLSSQPGTNAQQPSLTDFLQTLSQNLQDAPTSGALINVQA